jgi:hypothetical protein
LSEEFAKIHDTITDDDGNPFIIAQNIEKYANLYVIIGEMIARYQTEVDTQKLKVDTTRALQVYKEREIWLKEHDDKAPAMKYFEAKADVFVETEYKELITMRESLRRFKNSWESTDQKINALKKKYEAKKYELKFTS